MTDISKKMVCAVRAPLRFAILDFTEASVANFKILSVFLVPKSKLGRRIPRLEFLETIANGRAVNNFTDQVILHMVSAFHVLLDHVLSECFGQHAV